MNNYTIMETFVGAGGSHIGFKQGGFKAVFVNDMDKDCIDTLVLNDPSLVGECAIELGSIIDIVPTEMMEKSGLVSGDLDVFFGGIVCKGFSLAGERSPNDERNYYYHKHLELVEAAMPKISIIENVKAFQSGKVLSDETPASIKEQVDEVWQALENYKGRKAECRKRGGIGIELEREGASLRNKKSILMKKIDREGYLIPVLDDIYSIYDRLGYNVTHRVLNTAWYGAATKRERVIIVAVRADIGNEFVFPKPIFNSSEINTRLPEEYAGGEFKAPLTVGDAIGRKGLSACDDPDNKPMNHAKKTVDRFRHIKAGSNITAVMDTLPEHLKISSFYSRGNTMRLHFDKPAPTLVPGHSNFPVHPVEHRSITVREAALISGFPPDYRFVGNHSKRCEHVGNAVPPPLAFELAKQCRILLDGERGQGNGGE